MAAITPTAVSIASTGAFTQYIAGFNAVDTNDTWDSGITNAYGYWTRDSAPAGGSTLNGSSVSESAGVFTFEVGQDNTIVTLIVQAQQ